MSEASLKSSIFVIRNHENRYLTKKHEWRSGQDAALLFRTPEKDVALNELIEVNSKEIMSRLELVSCSLENKKPVVEVLAEDPPEELQEEITVIQEKTREESQEPLE